MAGAISFFFLLSSLLNCLILLESALRVVSACVLCARVFSGDRPVILPCEAVSPSGALRQAAEADQTPSLAVYNASMHMSVWPLGLPTLAAGKSYQTRHPPPGATHVYSMAARLLCTPPVQ